MKKQSVFLILGLVMILGLAVWWRGSSMGTVYKVDAVTSTETAVASVPALSAAAAPAKNIQEKTPPSVDLAESSAPQKENSEQISEPPAEAVNKVLDYSSTAAFEMIPGSWQKIVANDDGSFEAEYKTTNGATVHQWFNTKEELAIDEVTLADRSILHKWYNFTGNDGEAVQIIQYDNGKKGWKATFRANAQPKDVIFWQEGKPDTVKTF